MNPTARIDGTIQKIGESDEHGESEISNINIYIYI